MEYKNFKLFLNLFILISMIQSSFQIKNEEENLELVQQFIDQLMEDSTAKTPILNLRKSGWDYVDGVVMLGFLSLYSTTKDPKYLNFSEYFEDYRVSDDGTILGYKKSDYNLDNINSAKALITVYELTKIKKYRKAVAIVYQQLLEHPRTEEGNFWHKKIYTNQVWLDGIYMALPFYMEYEVLYLKSKNINDIYNQFFNVYKIMRDDKTGLYYHGYDSSREQSWADKKTGLSQNFWLRSIGWLPMAIIE
jgi:unsaturated rhamnogalacturonyl hydrolase